MKNQSKIMITVLTPVLSRLNTKIEKLMLRRDCYLNSVLGHEIKELDKENLNRNSDQARDYLLAQLKAMPTKSMSIALDKTLIARIDTVCKKINVARDCWINRILFFLAAENAQLNAIGITAVPHESLSINPLDAASELIFDPIFDCRDWMKKNSSSFYRWELQNQLVGMACYISDSDLPSASCPEVDLLEALGASPNYGKDITCN